MSKGKTQKAPAQPAFQNSAVYNGNQLVSQTYQDPTYGIVTKYNASPAQQQSQDLAQQQINSILPTLGQTDTATQKQIQDAENAYTQNATQQFNNIYDPSLRNLREDVASRFGTTKATPYYDQLNNLATTVQQPALLSIANTATQMGQQMQNTAQSQKLQQLQALGYVLNGDQQNFLNGLSSSQNNSNSGNQFNLANYQNALNQYQFNQNQGLQSQNLGLQALGSGLSAI
jgi:hypothetical protein